MQFPPITAWSSRSTSLHHLPRSRKSGYPSGDPTAVPDCSAGRFDGAAGSVSSKGPLPGRPSKRLRFGDDSEGQRPGSVAGTVIALTLDKPENIISGEAAAHNPKSQLSFVPTSLRAIRRRGLTSHRAEIALPSRTNWLWLSSGMSPVSTSMGTLIVSAPPTDFTRRTNAKSSLSV